MPWIGSPPEAGFSLLAAAAAAAGLLGFLAAALHLPAAPAEAVVADTGSGVRWQGSGR